MQHLRIEVRDTGIGIAPEKMNGLFTRFTRGRVLDPQPLLAARDLASQSPNGLSNR